MTTTDLDFTGWLAGKHDDAIDRLIYRAYSLGSRDAYAGRAALDVDDSGSADLMDALGLTEPTTAANQPLRLALCDEYLAGHDDASAALR